jgi:hypothetical protein
MSNLAGQKDLMTTLFTAFAGFSAFGAAIVAFLAGGGALQTAADWWRQHRLTGTAALPWPTGRQRADRRAAKRSTWAVVLTGAVIAALVVLPSGLGLLSSFSWLRASAGGSPGRWSWTYSASIYLFLWEAAAITVVTVVVVLVSAASSALPGAKQTDAGAAGDTPGQADGAGAGIRPAAGRR